MGEGKQLKLLLKEKGFTVKKLAKCIDLPPTTLYSIISRDSRINEALYKPIADALGMHIFDLVETLHTGFYKRDYEELYHEEETLADIHDSLNKLNVAGKQEAAKRVEELTHIDKYTKDE